MQALKSIFKLDIKKGIAGIFLAVFAVFLCWGRHPWHLTLRFALIFTAMGFLKIDVEKKWTKYLLHFLWGAVIVSATRYLPFKMITSQYNPNITGYRIFLNILIILIVAGVIFIITGSRKSLFTGCTLLATLVTVNCFIYHFRGKELSHMDFLSLKTALNVAGQYHIEVNSHMVWGWCIWLIAGFSGFCIPKLPDFSKKWGKLFALVVVVMSASVLWFGSLDIPMKTWEAEGTRLNGYYLNFYLGIRDSFVDKPENYNTEFIDAYAEGYIKNNTAEKKPNVIVIMNESYADFSIIGNVNSNVPITPFLNSLTKDTIKGYALASIYGSRTANSEFEVLTSMSMAFLPKDSVPYQQYVDKEFFTLPHLMNSYGYKSVATHPYFANGWSRNRIYPYLGFAESTFIESYPQENMLRKYVSDYEMFDYVLNILNTNESGKPLFIHGVTMQNHGGYDYEGENYTKTVELLGYSRVYPKAEQYFSIINETDNAMKNFITALENYEEDTIVLFFGDHFPKVENEFYDELYGDGFDTLDEQMLKYTIPFFIWANYDIPEMMVERTSLNYLAKYLVETAGLELPPLYSFLDELEGVIPAMNAQGYYSINQGRYMTYEEASGAEADWINQYSILQYNSLFDDKNRSEVFYDRYITPIHDLMDY